MSDFAWKNRLAGALGFEALGWTGTETLRGIRKVGQQVGRIVFSYLIDKSLHKSKTFRTKYDATSLVV